MATKWSHAKKSRQYGDPEISILEVKKKLKTKKKLKKKKKKNTSPTLPLLQTSHHVLITLLRLLDVETPEVVEETEHSLPASLMLPSSVSGPAWQAAMQGMAIKELFGLDSHRNIQLLFLVQQHTMIISGSV